MKRHKILSGVLAFSFPCLLNATVVLPLNKGMDSHPLKKCSTKSLYVKQQDSPIGVDSLKKYEIIVNHK